jgi:DNA-directed RNA polymerase specialized sigma24 family protein
MLTDRKAIDLARRERRQRRGGGKVLDEAACVDSSAGEGLLAERVDPEPSPAFAAALAEECQRLLDRLGTPKLQRVALLKMEGYTIEEIAAQVERVPRTVKRWLLVIRQIWEKELPP